MVNIFSSIFVVLISGLVMYMTYKLVLHITVLKKIQKSVHENNLLRQAKYSNKLSHLNKLNAYIQNEISIEEMSLDYFKSSLPMTDSNSGLLYLSQVENQDTELIRLFKSTEDLIPRVRKESVLKSDLTLLLNGSLFARKMALTKQFFSAFFLETDQFSDWIFLRLGPLNNEWQGILFLARNDGNNYTDIDIEIMESLASQFTVHTENLRLTAKYEDSQKIKNAFLSNMSHEIRTPLNAIIGYSEILEQTDSVLEKRSLIRSIQKNSAQLTTMLDNILDISKIEFGHIHTRKEKCQINSLIEKIIDIAQSRAKEKGLQFRLKIADGLPSHVFIDEARVQQILLNLIGNAIKFTDSGFIILKINFDINLDHSLLLKFSIIDHGVGISSASQMDLFQNFSQSDNSNTRKHGGLGLGLALSKRLALELGGNVTLVKSKVNQGSTFLFEVPCQIVKIETEPFKNELPVIISDTQLQFIFNKNVLIVEDAVDNQEIFKYFLSSAGAYVDIADNGELAIQMAKTQEYEFILMDIQIPILDGLQATRQIKKNGYLKPIIALTANTSIEDKKNCLSSGCIGIITKPVTQTTLTSQIQTLLKEHYERISNTPIT